MLEHNPTSTLTSITYNTGHRTAQPRPRWANHKSHVRKEHNTCNLATHCSTAHKETMVGAGKLVTTEDIKEQLSLALLESVGDQGGVEEMKRLEGIWRDSLQSWTPHGLKTRGD